MRGRNEAQRSEATAVRRGLDLVNKKRRERTGRENVAGVACFVTKRSRLQIGNNGLAVRVAENPNDRLYTVYG